MNDLHLNLSREDFKAVKGGEKKFITHAVGMLWSRILEGRSFSRVLFKHSGEVYACAWFGYEIQINTEREPAPWGPFKVYAIRVGAAL